MVIRREFKRSGNILSLTSAVPLHSVEVCGMVSAGGGGFGDSSLVSFLHNLQLDLDFQWQPYCTSDSPLSTS